MRRNWRNDSNPVLDNLVAQATLIKIAAALLSHETVSAADAQRGFAASIETLERDGDSLVRENIALLNREWATPGSRAYESSDLKILSGRLDDILDSLEEAAFRISAYRYGRLADGIPLFCNGLVVFADGLFEAFEEMARGTESPIARSRLSFLSGDADALCRNVRQDLFSREVDTMDLIKNKEICDVLDQVLKFCQSAANQLYIMESSHA